jgi:hypothetical protein
MSRSVAAIVAVLLLVLTTSCAPSRSAAEVARGPGGDLTANAVRACLDTRAWDDSGLVFRTTKKSSDNFVGVVMMDLTQSPVRTATVGIAVYPDALLVDAYEERARQDAEDEVARVRNAVVSYHGPFTGRLAVGERLVQRCVR